ncbi:hypothetical protein [Streptomyces spiralis]
MAHRTDPPTPQPTPHTPQPAPAGAFASRIITLAADHLSQHPQPTRCMNDHILSDAIRRAQDTVLTEVRPRSSHDLVRSAVRAMLLPPAGTVGEYADRLREMAVTG